MNHLNQRILVIFQLNRLATIEYENHIYRRVWENVKPEYNETTIRRWSNTILIKKNNEPN